MRDLLLSALLLASAFQTAVGEQSGDWTYIVENGGATITASTANGAVTIPSVLGGYAVKKVGNNYPSIFGNPIGLPGNPNTSVTSVTIPNSVTSIGDNAFSGCSGLTSVTIPNSVTSIENSAFEGCTSLTSINIPNGIIGIASNAFKNCSGLESVTFPTSLTSIENNAFEGCTSLRSIIIPNGVGTIGNNAFLNCTSLTSITIPDRYIAQIAQIGISGQVATDYLVNALANNDAFVTAVANKIKTKNGNYGLSTQSGLSSAISTAVQPLATKAELTSALTESRTAGVNSVLSNPNLWTLYTTSQIQNMAVGDLVLSRQVNGSFVLNYDIEQSTDLQTWTPYQALSLPLIGLPTDKAFVRIKAKQ